MLAYAANAPRHTERRSSPNAMLAIIAGHVALLAVVMSAKMELPSPILREPPIVIRWIDPLQPPPADQHVRTVPHPQSGPTSRDPFIPIEPQLGPDVVTDPAASDPGPIVGPAVNPRPLPTPMPVLSGPQLLTPPSELRPPYPPAKLASGEEAVLKLQLTIDERGRVIAVEPIGRADPAFVTAARRHLLAHWRYKPASEDGRAVAGSTVITLRFQLDG